MINVIVSGPFGRMGSSLCRLAALDPHIHLLAGLVRANQTRPLTEFALVESLANLPASKGRNVLIEFTEPKATLSHVREAAALNIPVIIGTTGFSTAELSKIDEYSQSIPILISANTSLGVNLLLDVVEKLASRLTGYDIEIVEAHHRNKKDAPSGTALSFARAAAAGRKTNLQAAAKYGREGFVGERPSEEIGIHAVRGGDIVGDHTILFAGSGERVEVTHKASSRDTFALGALYAARYIARQAAGVYSMADALGI